MTMTVFGFSVLGNTVDDATNFISKNSGLIGQMDPNHTESILSFLTHTSLIQEKLKPIGLKCL